MKIKDCFVLKNIAGINTVISTNSKTTFEGMITLNDTGVFMWKLLQDGITLDALVEKMVEEYEIDKAVAQKDAQSFIDKLSTIDVFE
ncbi:MAG: PqqD family protein [Clostridiales bacterium]|nr:PqqD family protein [Clostridiales bacterium]